MRLHHETSAAPTYSYDVRPNSWKVELGGYLAVQPGLAGLQGTRLVSLESVRMDALPTHHLRKPPPISPRFRVTREEATNPG